MGVNLLVDPGNVFNSGIYEEKIANILLNNHNAKGLTNFNERLVFEKIVLKASKLPNTVVLGTSRVLVLQQKHFASQSFRNLAMSHSTINDIIGQIGVFDSAKKYPSQIIIEATCILKAKTNGEDWLPLHSYHKNICQKLRIKNIETINYPNYYFFKRKLNAIVSLDYFQTSLKKFNLSYKKTVVDELDSAKMDSYGRYFDGSICNANAYNNIDTIKVMADSKLFIKNEGYPEVDVDKKKALEKLIDFCKQKNIKVTLLIMPFQIDCYKELLKTSYLNNCMVAFKNFAKTNNIDFIGTFNPIEAKLERLNFNDPLHCNSKSVPQILNIKQYCATGSKN